MRACFISLCFLALVSLNAEVLRNPDENTLWQEDFKTFAPVAALDGQYWKGGVWYAKEVECEVTQDGVLVKPIGRQGELKTCMPVKKEYPWLVVEVGSITMSNSYNSITFGHFKDGKDSIGLTREIKPCIFLSRMANENTKQGMYSVTSYFYGTQVCLNGMKLVKRPDVFPEVIVQQAATPGELHPGDKLLFRVTTSRKVKDVSLAFHSSKGEPIKLNGQSTLQLRPPGDDDCVWEAAVEVKEFVLGKKMAWLASARVLGGGFKKPVIFNVGLK